MQACLRAPVWMIPRQSAFGFFAAVKGSELINDMQKFIIQETGLVPATDILTPCHVPHMFMCLLWLQGVKPEARTFNIIVFACNLCGQPLQAPEVGCSAHSLWAMTIC